MIIGMVFMFEYFLSVTRDYSFVKNMYFLIFTNVM